MSFLSEQSEYAGIRIAMHDALQRYYAANGAALPDAEKIPALQNFIRAACHENRLLGARNDVVGAAWAEFIGTREPSHILAFLADRDVIENAAFTKPIKETVSTLNAFDALMDLAKEKFRNFNFEAIAQRTGVIDYRAGETLSQHLQDAEQRITAGQHVTPRPPKTPEHAALIRQAFDSPFGNVNPIHMGLPPASRLRPSPGKGVGR